MEHGETAYACLVHTAHMVNGGVIHMRKFSEKGLYIVLCIAALYFGVFSFLRDRTGVFASAPHDPPVTVVIDAGHGGEDGGASSARGVKESGINLEIAGRLEQILALSGVCTQMIRNEDVAVYSGNPRTIAQKKVSDLKNRVEMVNGTENALLVSVHQNYFPESRYHGAQVFYAATDGSQLLAKRVQEILRAEIDPKNRRECKKSNAIYLMEHIDCTGILVECGFLSNPAEAEALQNPTYQTKLAAAIANAVVGYLNEGDEAREGESDFFLHRLRQ